jgi:hypothetical protein
MDGWVGFERVFFFSNNDSSVCFGRREYVIERWVGWCRYSV